MMVDCWWRARVGLFLLSIIKNRGRKEGIKSTHSLKRSKVPAQEHFNKCEGQCDNISKTSTLCKAHEFTEGSVIESLDVILVIILPLLLILAGDVELNPGPTQKDSLTHKVLLMELKDVHEWFNFGLLLGVDMSELKLIEHQHRLDIPRCQAEMYDCWLKSALSPSWKDVIHALREMNHTRLANSILKKYLSKSISTPEPQTHADGITLFNGPHFWEHSMSVTGLSPTFQSRTNTCVPGTNTCMPGNNTCASRTNSQLASPISEVTPERNVETDFHSTIVVPDGKPPEPDLSIMPTIVVTGDAPAKETVSVSTPESSEITTVSPVPESSKVPTVVSAPASSEVPTIDSAPESSETSPVLPGSKSEVSPVVPSPKCNSSQLTVTVDNEIARSLFNLRMKFIKMHQGVKRSMETVLNIPLEDLKETLSMITTDDSFEHCEDYKSLFEKLCSRVNMFDPFVLSSLADTYGDPDTIAHIEGYETCLEKFRKNTKIQELEGILKHVKKEYFDAENMPCVIMKLPKKWFDCVLQALYVLANDVFGVKSKVLQGPVEIERGCVHITWYVLERFLEPLIEAAVEKVDVLQREELLLLRIGGVTVFQDGNLVKGKCGMAVSRNAAESEEADDSKQEPLSPQGEQMLRSCSDIVLMHIAHHITEWEPLVKFFALTEADRKNLRQGGIPNHRILWLWKQKEKEKATYLLLQKIFIQASNAALAGMVEEVVTGESLHSQDFAWKAFKQYLKDCYSTSASPLSGPSKVQKTLYVDCPLPVLLGEEGQERIDQIELESLFQRSETSKRLQRVLIEGVPGSGKTALTWHACQQWAKGNLFQEFDIMMHVSLADAHALTAECFIDLIPHPSAEVRHVVAEGMTSRYGRGCCIILDGWGDLATRSQGASVLLSCLEGSAQGAVLPHSSILITMRPMDTDRAPYHIASSVIQLKGFTTENVKQFVLEYFSECRSSPQLLLEALHEQPEALALCHLPVNLASVAFMFASGPCAFPSSQTELFRRLVNNHMLRNLCEQQGEMVVWSTSKLSSDDRQFYDAICRLGYDSVMGNKHTFSTSELEDKGLDMKKLTVFGPLRIKQQLTWRAIENSYGFVHSTIQHFFCALHMIQQMSKVQQKNTMQRIMADCPTAPVVMFFSGLTQLRNDGAYVALQHGFINSVPRSPMYPIARHSSWLLLNLVRCMCEADRIDMCRLIGPPPLFLSFSELQLSSYDCAVLGKFIASYCAHRKCHVNFEYCRMTEEELMLLMWPLVEAVVNGQLRQCTLGLNLDCNEVTLPVLECLRTICLSSAVLELSLKGINRHANIAESLQLLNEGLALCSSEPRISLSSCGFTVDHIPCIIPLVSVARLRLLDLSYSNFSGGLMPLFEAIKTNTSLTMLLLMAVGITDSDLIDLGYVLQYNSTLHSLALQRNDFSSSTFYSFIQIIQDRSSRSIVDDLHADQRHIDALPENFLLGLPILIRDCVPVWW